MTSTTEADSFRLPEAIALLETTPGVLQSLLQHLPHGWLHFKEDSDAWSPHTVLLHFVHNERTNWIPRLRVLLSKDAVRKFAPFDQLPKDGELAEEPAAQLIAKFAQLRQESLSFLRGLDLRSDQFDRRAEHPTLGTVSLGQLLATWVVHDLNHLHQITKSLAKRYQASVGPWRRNLAILDL
jgi:hypothetical protein